MLEPHITLRQKALHTLNANIQNTENGKFFVAGGHQFRTLWVRDFCFAVPGLLKAGFEEIVESQLKLIHSFRRQDQALPRGIDVRNPKNRVLWNTALRWFPHSGLEKYKGALKPEYLGEHGTPAFDSNLLFLRAICELADFQGKASLILSELEILKLLSFYDSFWVDGLLSQPEFSDWQDSARRSGSLLLTQLFYLEVIARLKKFGIDAPNSAQVTKLESRCLDFFDPKQKLFHEQISSEQISLDSHCLLLCTPAILPSVSREELYKNLKKHPLWIAKLVPGIPVYPKHPANTVSWTTKAVGLRNYHDGFFWGWLVAEGMRAAKAQGDQTEASRILDFFEESTRNDPYLAEIYEAKAELIRPVSRLLYQSEAPFTWTAAKWIEALA